MECSLEMKLQAIDKMIAMREQLVAMQSNYRMNNGFELGGKILAYCLEDLQELSKTTGNEIYETGYVSDTGWTEVTFEYKEIGFHAIYTDENRGGVSILK